MSGDQHNLMTIVIDWLTMFGYDGLFHPDGECGCEKADIMPCGEPSINCEPGYKGPPTAEHEGFFIYREKQREDGLTEEARDRYDSLVKAGLIHPEEKP